MATVTAWGLQMSWKAHLARPLPDPAQPRGVEKLPGSPIIFDMKSSRVLGEEIIKAGGKPVLWKTGHSYIKEKLHELGAPLAGEMSGHIFFGKPDYYGFDDSVFTALKMIELLARSKQSLGQMVAELPDYRSTPTLQANCKDELKYNIVAELVNAFKAEGLNVVTFEDLKLGGRVEFEYGWGWCAPHPTCRAWCCALRLKPKRNSNKLRRCSGRS